MGVVEGGVEMELGLKARLLLARSLGSDSGLEEAGVSCKHVRSRLQGDLFFSRRTATRVMEKLQEKVLFYSK